MTHGVRRVRTFRYPGFWTLFSVWSLIGMLAYTRYYLQVRNMGIHGSLTDLFSWMGCYYPWVLLTPIVFRLERRFPLGGPRWLRHLGYLALVSLPLCYFGSIGMIAFSRSIRVMLGAPVWRMNSLWAFWPYEYLIAEALYWCVVVAAYIIRSRIQLHEQEQTAAQLALEKSQLEIDLRQAELEALRARLNPHFLFNTLQNISVLAQQDPRTASRMLARLGDLLRVVLRSDSQSETTLDEEFAFTRAYVALEKMRFGDRLTVCFEADADPLRAAVPTFLLQPLVENAIVHGLKDAHHAGVIVVRGGREGEDLVLTVNDNGIGPPTEDLSQMKIGIGLGSTGERLARMYPDRHSLSMRALPEGGTEVRITIPFRDARVQAGPLSNAYAPAADR